MREVKKQPITITCELKLEELILLSALLGVSYEKDIADAISGIFGRSFNPKDTESLYGEMIDILEQYGISNK